MIFKATDLDHAVEIAGSYLCTCYRIERTTNREIVINKFPHARYTDGPQQIRIEIKNG